MIGSIKDVIENKAVRHTDEFGVDEERSLITFEANDFQDILLLRSSCSSSSSTHLLVCSSFVRLFICSFVRLFVCSFG